MQGRAVQRYGTTMASVSCLFLRLARLVDFCCPCARSSDLHPRNERLVKWAYSMIGGK